MAWEFLRGTYDTVSESYEARFHDELDRKPRDRELLDAFGASVGDPVLDVGCGPGHIGAYLKDRRTYGLDLSGEMAKLAARRLSGAAVADMRALPIGSGRIGGVVAFYSLIHLRREEVAAVLGEFNRVLGTGGRVLLSVHEGSGEVTLDEFVGHQVPFVATLFELDELSAACEQAGFDVALAERREHYEGERTTRLYVEALKPGFTARRPD